MPASPPTVRFESDADTDADNGAHTGSKSSSTGTVAPKAPLQRYDLDPEPITQYEPKWNDDVSLALDVAEIIQQITDTDAAIIHTDPRPADIDHSVADITKARKQLGYEPQVSLRAGIEAMQV